MSDNADDDMDLNGESMINNSNNQVKAFKVTKSLFKTARQMLKLKITGIEETDYEIPLLPDRYGLTPLDICLGIHKQDRKMKYCFFERNEALKS